MKTKTIFPTDFRDYLSITSMLGFIGMFLKFCFGKTLLSDVMDSLFLIIGGVGLMVSGKVFEIKNWTSDGIQKNEITQVLSIILGISGMIIGFMLLFGVTIPIKMVGLVGVLALAPAIYIFLDYLKKNT